ncbi:MAG: hypothetical protein K2H31_07980 [Lachnospiraceae bacterium]|nr:hypothetical protein [Lachnospiraceae bacterium]
MRHIHSEEPVQYHVIQWSNSAFHNHEIVKKRKLLGGVYLDGGGAGAGSDKGESISQTGVQNAQPSFPDGYINDLGLGIGTGGQSSMAKGNQKDSQNVKSDSVKISGDIKKANNNITTTVINMVNTGEMQAIQQFMPIMHDDEANKITSVGEQEQTDNKQKLIIRKYIGGLRKFVQNLMKGMGQKTDSRSSQNRKKQDIKATRAITKEEVYEIQINTSYLLDSYNKYGERSTLGKQ